MFELGLRLKVGSENGKNILFQFYSRVPNIKSPSAKAIIVCTELYLPLRVNGPVSQIFPV